MGQHPVALQVSQRACRGRHARTSRCWCARWPGRARNAASVAPPRPPGATPGRGPRRAAPPSPTTPPVPARRGRRPVASRPEPLAGQPPSAITSSGPASSEPTGAHRPLDRQHITVVAAAAQSAAGHPRGHLGVEQPCAVHVDGDRAGRLDHRAQSRASGPGAPDAAMCVFSMQTERHRGLMVLRRLARPADVVGAHHAVAVVELDELDARRSSPPRRTRRPPRAGGDPPRRRSPGWTARARRSGWP